MSQHPSSENIFNVTQQQTGMKPIIHNTGQKLSLSTPSTNGLLNSAHSSRDPSPLAWKQSEIPASQLPPGMSLRTNTSNVPSSQSVHPKPNHSSNILLSQIQESAPQNILLAPTNFNPNSPSLVTSSPLQNTQIVKLVGTQNKNEVVTSSSNKMPGTGNMLEISNLNRQTIGDVKNIEASDFSRKLDYVSKKVEDMSVKKQRNTAEVSDASSEQRENFTRMFKQDHNETHRTTSIISPSSDKIVMTSVVSKPTIYVTTPNLIAPSSVETNVISNQQSSIFKDVQKVTHAIPEFENLTKEKNAMSQNVDYKKQLITESNINQLLERKTEGITSTSEKIFPNQDAQSRFDINNSSSINQNLNNSHHSKTNSSSDSIHLTHSVTTEQKQITEQQAQQDKKTPIYKTSAEYNQQSIDKRNDSNTSVVNNKSQQLPTLSYSQQSKEPPILSFGHQEQLPQMPSNQNFAQSTRILQQQQLNQPTVSSQQMPTNYLQQNRQYQNQQVQFPASTQFQQQVSNPLIQRPQPLQFQHVQPVNTVPNQSQPNQLSTSSQQSGVSSLVRPNINQYQTKPPQLQSELVQPPAPNQFQVNRQPTSGHQIIQPPSSGHQVIQPPTSGQHQIIQPLTSGQHQIIQPPTSGQHQIIQPPTSGQYQFNQPPTSGQLQINRPPTSGQLPINPPLASGQLQINRPPTLGQMPMNVPPTSGQLQMNQPPISGQLQANQSPSLNQFQINRPPNQPLSQPVQQQSLNQFQQNQNVQKQMPPVNVDQNQQPVNYNEQNHVPLPPTYNQQKLTQPAYPGGDSSPINQPKMPTSQSRRYPTQTYQNYGYQNTVPQQNYNQPQMQPQYKLNQNQVGNIQQTYQSDSQGNLNVTQTGFNRLWGCESYDLLQNRNILPPGKVEPGKVVLAQECLNSANCSPDIFRCTMTKIPESNSLLNKSRLPLGVLIHPFKDLNHLPVIQCNSIVRCRACRTYINPFVYFVDSKRWKCNLCYRVNELPEEFQYDPLSKTYGDPTRRPEIKSSTIEYIAPSEYMVRPPQPAVYLYVLDVSRLAVESGYLQVLCNALTEEIDNIPGDARTQIGFICFNSSLHFYLLADGLNQPHEMTIVDIDDIFLPCPSLLVNLKERKEMVKDLLSQLPTRFENSHDTGSALGAVLQAAFKMMSPTGGRVSVFQCSLPSIGPGQLVSREVPSQRAGSDVPHLNPATDFYKRLALDCSAQQVTVDLFILNSQYVDMSTISDISRFSAGCIHHWPLFKSSRSVQVQQFDNCLRRYLTRKIGYEAVMRIRCTRGLAIHTFHGNFFVRSTDLLSLPNCNPDSGFGMQVAIEESLTDLQTVCFQAALLYTSSKGERRIRVHTLCLPVATTLSDVLNSADQQCIVGLLAKMAVDRSFKSSLTDARDAFINAAIDILSAYKLSLNQGSGMGTGLLAPHSLRLLPLYIVALLKYIAFRIGVSTRLDDRVFAMCEMKNLPLVHLIQQIYPDLYAVHLLTEEGGIVDDDGKVVPQPARLQLSAEKLDSRGAFLLDCGNHMQLYIGHSASTDFVSRTLGYPNFNAIPDECYELPRTSTPDNDRLHTFINHLNFEKPFPATIQLIRDNSPLRIQFTEKLIEDRIENALSYYEFLQHLKTHVK